MTQTSNGSPALPADEPVHVGLAAKALGVSRRTVERMIERGELERDVSRDGATVTKSSLTAALERRGNESVDLEHLARDFSRSLASEAKDVRELVEPLVEQVVEAQTRAAEAEAKVKLLEERAQSSRDRDELVATLVAGSWGERRRARKALLANLAQP
jgi:hypothetical protein